MAEDDPRGKFTVSRCPGPGWEDILKDDDIAPPPFMSEDRYRYLGSEAIDAARYYDPEFFKLECEKMWPNVWQFVAREEDMPEPGDYVTYDNAGRSFLVVRQDDGSVRAFHNVCLHRGRKLKTDSGSADQFVCPFHGFAWNKDGALKNIPCRWDFGHLTDEKMQLPEATVAQWGGYIFLRENPEGPSIEEWLDPLPEFFTEWRHEDCATVAWVGKVVNANWKIVMEAFMESYHAYVTHPQLMPFTGDANAAYHVLGDNVNVNYTPFGTMSPHVQNSQLPQQWIVDEFVKYNGRSADNYDPEKDEMNLQVPDGLTARQALGQAMRDSSARAFGGDYSGVSESELLDALVYNVFPNFAPWGGFMPNIVYRWRPWPDQDRCLMEVRVIARVPEGQPRPTGVEMHLLSDDECWSDAPELGVLGGVVDQDMENMELTHQGLQASKNQRVELGDYQEVRIRHFHQALDRYVKD
ncbi:(2Fe-2S)-binding protein [Novosphingobium marinum]|uniref:Phenylpropionate dioxygenase-like ring-hydroxylating dioxygenase large terminal subunit n=1 Tax=Novosphingobium marinum TaxID=1514948 RepID=A0A7Z0BUC5_9SPHN|nr:aromatic ring-hydroxylating dioxygenase subunit alpha [Novosphingobium marinum]NYH94057.1 phenylpropionate dioxygenase-like ring-hydroxylating dioxygenase large terminal subunit [Novosphingobium marinum]GGC19258.1 (2Fe-2S)-binding protein [Novosphingobium marinum]